MVSSKVRSPRVMILKIGGAGKGPPFFLFLGGDRFGWLIYCSSVLLGFGGFS